MKTFLPRLLKELQIGYYMVNVNRHRNGQAFPITKRERTEFEGIASRLGNFGKHPVNWEPGSYLIHKDGLGNLEIVGMNKPECKAFLAEVIGRF